MSKTIALELLKIAKDMKAINFATQEQLNKYLRKHPKANRRNHKVVPNPAKVGKEIKAATYPYEDVWDNNDRRPRH